MLAAEVDALVNPVNTEGVMGKGLALQFKKAFPDAFVAYERACAAGEVVTGRMHVVRRVAAPRFIINFPTKKHWRQPSRIEYVRDGLIDLIALVRELGIRSIAVPPLGCGNGGLDWKDVKPLSEQAFTAVPDVREGHYTRGQGDGKNSPETPFELLPGALEAAHEFLKTLPGTRERLERVARLIDGFETPFGAELLGTVHWVMRHGADPERLDDVIAKVHSWNPRKRSQMKDGHIRAAWTRLRELGWA